MRGVLLVGTDTGVGKTSLACGILRVAYRKHYRLLPFKPVETGCAPAANDAELLCTAAAIPELRPSDVCPIQLPTPVAPSVAARLAGRPISSGGILEAARTLATRADALLVESAGGLLTPYGPGLTSASLANLFDIDIMLVSANRLGTINHTALALREITRRRLRLVGLVLVDVTPPHGPDRPFNASEIAALTGVSPLGTLRHCPIHDPDTLADAVMADLDLSRLLDGALV